MSIRTHRRETVSKISTEAIKMAVRHWGEHTGALTGSGRPNYGETLDSHNRQISERVRAICDAIVEAVEQAPTSAVWCDLGTPREVGVQALSDTLERAGLSDALSGQLDELTHLIADNDRYRETFTPFIEEAAGLLQAESESQARLLRELCLEHS